MNLIKKLYDLQTIDMEIKNALAEIDRINFSLEDEESIIKIKNEISEINNILVDLKKQKKDIDWEIEDLRKNISQLNNKLYGGKIKNPKELVDLEKDVSGLKIRLGEKEDLLLELMEKEENIQNNLNSFNEQLREKEIERKQDIKKLSDQKSAIEQKMEVLSKARENHIAEIDSEALKTYDKIASKKGMAVVSVEQGRCKGCRISLSMNELQRARSGVLVQCGSCGMILFTG